MSYAIRNDGLGWRAIGAPEEVGAHETYSETQPPALPPVPVARVSALQGLLAIDQAGLALAYDAWASDPSRTFAERAFINKAQEWHRNDPTLIAAASALGLSGEQVDAMFELAATR